MCSPHKVILPSLFPWGDVSIQGGWRLQRIREGEGEQTAQANYFKVRLCHSQNRRGKEERKLLKEKGREERKAKRLHGGGGWGRGSALLCCVCVCAQWGDSEL